MARASRTPAAWLGFRVRRTERSWSAIIYAVRSTSRSSHNFPQHAAMKAAGPGRSRGGWCGIRLSIQAALPLPAEETLVPAALLAQMLAREQVVALVPCHGGRAQLCSGAALSVE